MAPLQYGLNLTQKKANAVQPKPLSLARGKQSDEPQPGRRKGGIFDDDDEDTGGQHSDEDEDGNVFNKLAATKKSSSGQAKSMQQISTFDLGSGDRKSSSSGGSISRDKDKNTPAKHGLADARPIDLASRLASTKQTKAATELDASIYDYDAAYDAQQAAERVRKEDLKRATEKKGPRHMADLLAAAEVRKRDQTRARDKLIQREREAEGDEFADKDAFVTDAYRAQQAETRRLQEQEKEEADKEERLRKSGAGMTSFYKNLMREDDKRHAELMSNMQKVAAERPVGADGREENSTEPGSGNGRDKTQKQADLAQKLRAQGKDVVLTDDGAVADKRQLLSAGLNVARKPKEKGTGPPGSGSGRGRENGSVTERGGEQGYGSGRLGAGAGGKGAGQRSARERQTRQIEEQLAQAAKRAAEEEEEEQEKLQRAAKSRKTEREISSARERYLQRKREAAGLADL